MEKIKCHLINLSICLSDIDTKQMKKAYNGKIYLNACVGLRKEKDQYGNDLNLFYSRSKEEKEAGIATQYVKGNARMVNFDSEPPPEFLPEPPVQSDLVDLPY